MPASSTSLIIHTLNTPKSLKPTTHGQVADAVHQTLHFALDGRAEDWQLTDEEWREQQQARCGGSAAPLSGAQQSHIKAGFIPQPISSLAQSRPHISYLHTRGSSLLNIPHPASIPDPTRTDPCAVDDRQRFDVTAKVFLSGHADADQAHIEEALAVFRRNTGLLTVDTLLLSWPEVTDRAVSGNGQVAPADVERVRSVWQTTSASPYVASMGLCDLPITFLQSLFPGSPINDNGSTSSIPPSPPSVPSNNRLPRVISLSSDRNPPCSASQAALLEWCRLHSWLDSNGETEHVQILTHSDPREMLPPQSLPSILDEFKDRIPIPDQHGQLNLPPTGWAESLEATWLLKYTVLISDRSLLTDAGYIVRADTARTG